MKKLRYYLITFLAILFLPLFFSGNSFADSNPTYTLTSVPSDRLYLCNDTDASISVLNIKCSDYSYLNITISGDAQLRLNSNYGGYSNNIALRSGNFRFYTFDTSESSNLNIDPSYSSSVVSSGSSVIFVFSNTPIGSSSSSPSGSLSITENGTYDVTNYAEAVVNVPEPICEDCDTPFIVSLFKDSFWGIITAFVSLIVPVLALFLIFRLVHDWLWGKG